MISGAGGVVGTSTFLLDAMPRDNTKKFGEVQARIWVMLDNMKKLSPWESKFLQNVYCQHQQNRGKLSKAQLGRIFCIWREKFDGQLAKEA